MPELPEVETTKRGIHPHILGQRVNEVQIRKHQLRWAIPEDLPEILKGKEVTNTYRRAKYLLIEFDNDTTQALLVHLGMSGSFRICDLTEPAGKHDHVDFVFGNHLLRYCDPRRFGCILWLDSAPEKHKLLRDLGLEPLETEFDGAYLYNLAKNKKTSIKQLVMDQKVVTGIGNIYATEALFKSGILPDKPANKVPKKKLQLFTQEVKSILATAIKQGGTSLKDFIGGDGKPGYFKQELLVYGKKGKDCPVCNTKLEEIRLSNRASVYCPNCQS